MNIEGQVSFLLLAGLLVAVGTTQVTGSDRRTTGEALDDAAVTASVKAGLIGEPSIQARRIDVETINGDVSLTGFVDHSDLIHRAGEIARTRNGVRSVRNDLHVRESN